MVHMNVFHRFFPVRALCRSRYLFAALLILLLVVLHLITGVGIFTPSPYNTYTIQAMAWREGRMHLPYDIPHLELAIFENRYYVSFPPVPSVPVFFLTFLFGYNVPDGLLIKAYALIAFLSLVRTLRKEGWKEASAAAAAFLLCTASSMLPLLMTGAVWYQAQVMAFMLTVLAMEGMQADKTTWGLFCYALSVGCRPFNALYGPLLIALFLHRQSGHERILVTIKKLLPGIVLGLCVAAAYAWYNWARFGNPLEFGHNHLPEFSFQGGTQFSLRHVPKNAATFLWGLPFSIEGRAVKLKQFGFSLFLSNPVLLCMLGWVLRDGWCRRLAPSKLLVLGIFLLHLLLLLCHRTFGGYQYGARYAIDLIPYSVFYLLCDREATACKRPCIIVMVLGLCMAVWGSLTILLPF